jgi:hypothetical protein
MEKGTAVAFFFPPPVLHFHSECLYNDAIRRVDLNIFSNLITFVKRWQLWGKLLLEALNF